MLLELCVQATPASPPCSATPTTGGWWWGTSPTRLPSSPSTLTWYSCPCMMVRTPGCTCVRSPPTLPRSCTSGSLSKVRLGSCLWRCVVWSANFRGCHHISIRSRLHSAPAISMYAYECPRQHNYAVTIYIICSMEHSMAPQTEHHLSVCPAPPSAMAITPKLPPCPRSFHFH